jgi:hypothetical protein
MIGQMDLVHAMLHAIEQEDGRSLNVRQFNAILRAADDVLEELKRPHAAATPGMGMEAWLACDDRGDSSNAIAVHLAPLIHRRSPIVPWNTGKSHPIDPADFGRCVRLLEAEPLLRPHFPKMAKVSPQWAALVAVWDELEALYREEFRSGQAPKLYQRMQELLSVDPTGASSHAAE